MKGTLMGLEIRPATAADAASWLELVKAALGEQYPAKELYDLNWIARELAPGALNETWVAQANGSLRASVSFLGIEGLKTNPIANLGRMLFRRDSLTDGSAKALLQKVNRTGRPARGNRHHPRLPAGRRTPDSLRGPGLHLRRLSANQAFAEQENRHPFLRARGQGGARHPPAASESLPQVAELAIATFENLRIVNPIVVRDGACGYPLQSDLKISGATPEDYQAWRAQAAASNPPQELSGRFNMGSGHMRVPPKQPMRAFLGKRPEDRGRLGLLL